MTFKDRLIEFLKHIGIGQTNFESITGLGRASISKIKDGMSSPNLAKIAKAYPELNINWLITGEGEMLKTNTPKVEVVSSEQSVPYFLYKELLDRNERLTRENERLTELLRKNNIDYKKAI